MISELRGEVLTGPERRRHWSLEQKLEIVAEASRCRVAAVAQRHGVSTGLLYTWRRQAARGELALPPAVPSPELMPVCVVADAGPGAPPAATGVMVIELAGGRRIHVDGQVDAAALHRVLSVLEGR